MKLSTYTLLVSATSAVQMRSMMEPVTEPTTDEPTALECFFDNGKCAAKDAKDLPEGETDTCVDFKDKESCEAANMDKDGAMETGETKETDVTEETDKTEETDETEEPKLEDTAGAEPEGDVVETEETDKIDEETKVTEGTDDTEKPPVTGEIPVIPVIGDE